MVIWKNITNTCQSHLQFDWNNDGLNVNRRERQWWWRASEWTIRYTHFTVILFLHQFSDDFLLYANRLPPLGSKKGFVVSPRKLNVCYGRWFAVLVRSLWHFMTYVELNSGRHTGSWDLRVGNWKLCKLLPARVWTWIWMAFRSIKFSFFFSPPQEQQHFHTITSDSGAALSYAIKLDWSQRLMKFNWDISEAKGW